MTLLLFILGLIVLMFFEYQEYKTLFTPFGVILIPIALISLYVNLIGVQRGFKAVTSDSLIFLSLNLFAIWLAGQLIFFANFKKFNITKDFENVKGFVQKNAKTLLIIMWVAIFGGFFRLFSFVRQYGVNMFGTKIFEEAYGRGVFAHLTLLGYPSFILLTSLFPKNLNKKVLFTSILLMGFVLLVSGVKYQLILPVISIFLIYFFIGHKRKILYFRIILLGFVLLVIFFGSYLFTFSVRSGISVVASVWPFLIRHFEDYLLAGPIALGGYLSNYKQIFSFKDLFTVPLNIYKWLAGMGNFSTVLWTQLYVDISQTVTVNVRTMFGAFYLAVGYWGSVFFSLILGFISYLLYFIAFRSKKVGWVLLNSWMLAVLSLSFFGIQFHLLAVWEVAFYSLLIPVLCFILGEVFSKSQRRFG
jgi:oligosaccharide repeat unit polymerase